MRMETLITVGIERTRSNLFMELNFSETQINLKEAMKISTFFGSAAPVPDKVGVYNHKD